MERSQPTGRWDPLWVDQARGRRRTREILFARPESALALSFAALIVLGAILLRLPLAHAGPPVGWVDCLFTATSAVCVTGLVTVDTATAWSHAGHLIILALIQVGGLGIMTFAAFAARIFRMRLSFQSSAAWQGSFFESAAPGDLRKSLGRIFVSTFVIEAIGATLIWFGLRGAHTPGGPFAAVFHSISAFCNAGFSIYPRNAVDLQHAPFVLFTLMALIVTGGLGYMVLFEVAARTRRWLRHSQQGAVVWTLHARIVLCASGALIIGGMFLLLLVGLGPQVHGAGHHLFHALFQSVTARTAGFNTIDIGALPVPALLILTLLMFIGGSPGSCAGGVKTTAATVWSARVRARLLGREHVTVGRRQVPHEVVRRAALVIATAVLLNAVGVFLLALTESGTPGVRLEQLLFEQVSAFGTVGLSANLTPLLTAPGKLWIVLTMFLGRVGPLTLALAVRPSARRLFEYPPERVMIG
ncbi:MAG: potassium transporter TrkG [Planctomycetota bacterium]